MHPKAVTEHERRFLLADASVLEGLSGTRIEQGYLFARNGWKGRVRREFTVDETGTEYGLRPVFTIKGPKERWESVEYSVTLEESHAESLLRSAEPFVVHKSRVPVISEGETWDVDIFLGLNEGLGIAEFEGSAQAVSRLRRPWWCGPEITHDSRFFNENLARLPWQSWGQEFLDNGLES